MTESPQGAFGMGTTMRQLTDILGADVGRVLDRIRNSGLAAAFASWVGRGPNLPVTPEQIADALGAQHLAKIADQTGVAPDQAARNIADRLPGLVDDLTPDGDQSRLAVLRHHPVPASTGVEALMRDESGRPLGGGAGPPM